MIDPTDPRIDDFKRTALVHVDEVFRFAHRLSRNVAVADDLVQETFLQAWRSFDRFERGTNCRAWLFRILYFVWSHERRRRGRDPVVFDSAACDNEILLYDPPTPDSLTEKEVLVAFSQLAEPLRDVVLLADVEELTYREISELIGVPMGTVMSRLNRGRKLLRLALAGYAQARGIGIRRVSAVRSRRR